MPTATFPGRAHIDHQGRGLSSASSTRTKTPWGQRSQGSQRLEGDSRHHRQGQGQRARLQRFPDLAQHEASFQTLQSFQWQGMLNAGLHLRPSLRLMQGGAPPRRLQKASTTGTHSKGTGQEWQEQERQAQTPGVRSCCFAAPSLRTQAALYTVSCTTSNSG